MFYLKLLSILFTLFFTFRNTIAEDIVKDTRFIKKMNFSTEGKYLCTANSHCIKIWNGDTRAHIKSFPLKDQMIKSVFFLNESKWIGIISSKCISIIDIETGKQIQKINFSNKEIKEAIPGFNYMSLIILYKTGEVSIWNYEIDGFKEKTSIQLNQNISGMALSFDGKLLALSSKDKSIYVWNTINDTLLCSLKGHIAEITTMAFHPFTYALVSGDKLGSVLLWENFKLDKPLTIDKYHKGWIHNVLFSNDGKYLISSAGDLTVKFFNIKESRVAKVIKLSNPSLSLSMKPDGREIAIACFGAIKGRIFNVSDLDIKPRILFKNEKDKEAPQLFLSNPQQLKDNRASVSSSLIDIKGAVLDNEGVSKFKVNDQDVPVKENGSFSIWIALKPGENFIRIEATDVNNNTLLKKFIIVRKDEEFEFNPETSKNYLLVVGMNNYKYWPKLNNAVKDAKDVYRTLTNKYTFDTTNSIILLDSQATRTSIFNAMKSFIGKVGPNDNFLIYFSGHGHYDEILNEGFWIPFEAKVMEEGDYLPNTSILKIIQNINSRHILLISDACFSGALFAESSRGYIENVEQYKSRWGLASGRLEKVSDGKIGTNSPFAQSLLEFLVQNEKEKVLASELIQFVKIKVSEISDQTPIGNPLKNCGDEGGEFIFYKRK
jgi:hypothetical protein